MSNSVQPHRRQPTRLPRPWDSPGKNTGVGCHFLLQCMKVKSKSEVAQLCLTLSDPMDCSLPGTSIHGIFQVRVLEWGAIAFSVHLSKWSLSNQMFKSTVYLICPWFFLLLLISNVLSVNVIHFFTQKVGILTTENRHCVWRISSSTIKAVQREKLLVFRSALSHLY